MKSLEIITEEINQQTLNIDLLDTIQMLKKINDEDKKVALAVEKEIPNIAKAIDEIAPRVMEGGRLFYIGAGTSGRLGVLDASECPPTFGVDPEMVQAIIAGGDRAIKMSVEGAEDDIEGGKRDLLSKNLNPKDVVVGLAASGRTPYVIGALKFAKEVGALTVGICCTSSNLMQGYTDIMITPIVGPEVIAGSTRMKAGTAQKMVLNMISTGVMIKLGKVYGNLMINLKATNQKLQNRAKRIVKLITGAPDDVIEKILIDTGYDVKNAIFMLLTGAGKDEANNFIERHRGNLRKALLDWEKQRHPLL